MSHKKGARTLKENEGLGHDRDGRLLHKLQESG